MRGDVNVTEAQCESKVQPHGLANDICRNLRREYETGVIVCSHLRISRISETRSLEKLNIPDKCQYFHDSAFTRVSGGPSSAAMKSAMALDGLIAADIDRDGRGFRANG